MIPNVKKIIPNPIKHTTKESLYRTSDLYYNIKHIKSEKIIFVTALPKSGSTWLLNLLSGLNGYRPLPIKNSAAISTAKHRFDPRIITEAPLWGRFYTKLHVEADADGIAAMKQTKTKGIVLVRDPRDQVISRYYHVLADAKHRHHNLYNRISREEGIAYCCHLVALEYFDWIRGWTQAVASHPDMFLFFRFRDLKNDPRSVLASVLEFNNVSADASMLDMLIKRAEAKKLEKLSLGERLQNGSTFRNGNIGDWKKYLNDDHAKIMKDNGIDDILKSIDIPQD